MDPREEEIARIKDQTNEMDAELQKLNAVNENLGVIIDDLRQRQEEMQNESNTQRGKLRELSSKIQSFKEGIYDGA